MLPPRAWIASKGGSSSPLAAALFGPAAAARASGRQVGCTPNHLETLSPQTPQHGTALPAMLLQPSCGDSTCQRASHVGVDVALHGGDAAPSPGMRRHRAGATGHGAEDPRTTVRTTAIHIHSTHTGQVGAIVVTGCAAVASPHPVGCQVLAVPGWLLPQSAAPGSATPAIVCADGAAVGSGGSCRRWNRRAPTLSCLVRRPRSRRQCWVPALRRSQVLGPASQVAEHE